jgi:hypothetical protein
MMEKRSFSMKKLIVSFLALLMISCSPAIFADFGDVLGPTVAGAAIGGIAGGGRGAGIGAGVGFGIGLINSAEQDRRRAYYYDDYEYSRPIRYRRTYRRPIRQNYQYYDDEY